MQLFYIRDISDTTTLTETESKHAVRVLRLTEGDRVNLIDGKGGFFEAEIIKAHPKQCMLKIISSVKEYEKRNFNLHIAIAPTKSIDRFEWFLEKSTELGIDEITPLICDHSERKVVKPNRLNKVLIAAMKQSLKAYLPHLHPAVTFKDFLAQAKYANQYIAHCQDGEKVRFKECVPAGEEILVLIGPEGDFSPEEINAAKARGFTEISLGKSRLRTETAGIAACHITNLQNETGQDEISRD